LDISFAIRLFCCWELIQDLLMIMSLVFCAMYVIYNKFGYHVEIWLE
jgi:hypothetical protein